MTRTERKASALTSALSASAVLHNEIGRFPIGNGLFVHFCTFSCKFFEKTLQKQRKDISLHQQSKQTKITNIMMTTIYQKFIPKYGETFTLIDMTDGKDYIHSEMVPADIVSRLNDEEFDELFNELFDSDNEKASWNDEEEEFDEEDARTSYHQKWDEIDSSMDNTGM